MHALRKIKSLACMHGTDRQAMHGSHTLCLPGAWPSATSPQVQHACMRSHTGPALHPAGWHLTSSAGHADSGLVASINTYKGAWRDHIHVEPGTISM